MTELRITYVDEARNQFVDLGPPERAFDDIPEANEETDFMVDKMEDGNLVGEKRITRATAESLLVDRDLDIHAACEAQQRNDAALIKAWNTREDSHE